VQDITRTHAEEYVHRSEGFLRDAQEFLKDAVKVVPPEEGGGSVPPVGAFWDGTDVWMLPAVGASPASSKEKGKQREGSFSSGRKSAEGLRAVATRAEALLKQLRHDPAVIKVDPEADETVKEIYDTWVRDFVSSRDSGILGVEWTTAAEKAVQDPIDGEALKSTRDSLVPSIMTDEVFWTRYFFRVHQVEQEEERRKALLQNPIAHDDEFSWEDDEDESNTAPEHKAVTSDVKTPVPDSDQAPLPKPPAEETSPANGTSPGSDAEASRRQSSEASYDVVSSQVSNAGDAMPETKEADDDAESDWE